MFSRKSCRIVRWIDEEDYSESDDEIDLEHINCDFLDESGEKVVLTGISSISQLHVKGILCSYMTQSLLMVCLFSDNEHSP